MAEHENGEFIKSPYSPDIKIERITTDETSQKERRKLLQQIEFLLKANGFTSYCITFFDEKGQGEGVSATVANNLSPEKLLILRRVFHDLTKQFDKNNEKNNNL